MGMGKNRCHFLRKPLFLSLKTRRIGRNTNPASHKARANRNPGKKTKAPKKYPSTRRKRRRATALPESIPAAPKETQASFGSKGQLPDNSINELDFTEPA